MLSYTRLIAVGAFVLGGLLLFSVGLFIIGERRMLFENQFMVFAEFDRIAALQNGAKVRVAGMDAGEVVEINVPSGPSAKFRVRMRVREDLHPLVRTDSVASIQTEGVVGNKFVQIETGSDGAPRVSDNGTIPGQEPLDIADLLKQAADTIQMVTETVEQLRGDVIDTVRTIGDTAQNANELIDSLGSDLKSITTSGRQIATNTQAIIADVRAGRGTIGKLANDDELYRRATQIAQQAELTMANLREASQQAKQALASFQSVGQPAQGLVADFRQTLESAREVMTDLAEDAEALKRNWLFRGFFRDRGYYDLDLISPVEYRQGFLEGDARRKLSIWLRASVLFERNAQGEEVLNEQGKIRLDSAMAEFIKYPATDPIMVEGYATNATRDVAYLLSRDRAGKVREYIVGRFQLSPTRVGLIPLGTEADESPDGKSWDGVAIAIFTSRKPASITKAGGDN